MNGSKAGRSYERYHNGTAVHYWIVRKAGRLDEQGRECCEVWNAQRGRVVRPTDPGDVACVARLCNALNRLDGYVDAPIFDERTGRPIEPGD